MPKSLVPFRQRSRAGGRPFQKGQPRPPGAGRKKGSKNKVPTEIKAFMREFMSSEQYQKNVKVRVLAGKAPAVELCGLHWTGGKPKETHEVSTPTLSQLLKLALTKPETGG